ncbi:hypothetical protein [Haemophilus pittmaniae]|nr:hypothetical protein [Haemophilus pittmaniae]
MACAVGFFISANKINDLGVVFGKTPVFVGAFYWQEKSTTEGDAF